MQVGARSDAAGGDGTPLPVYRGAVWPGWAIQAVPRGRRVWLPPIWGGCHARPARGIIQEERGAKPWEATGRTCECTGAHQNGAGGADGGRTGRP